MDRLRAPLVLLSIAVATGVLAALPDADRAGAPPSLILLTLDTTRSDHVGNAALHPGLTPNLDALAARGLRYAKALSPAPLTLPAHASLLTGLDPPGHGVHDNGTAALDAAVPTLAKVLSGHGYATAAFLSSRVLDRRFGLDRGFNTYDDRMAAERTGEYGYPERDAEAVTSAALSWAERRPRGRPYFLWVHYYDPHAPYAPPGEPASASPAARYAGEIAYMDRQIGRLLQTLAGNGSRTLIAAVGDHGEMLGEHGEAGHGIFLYGGSLEVPMIIAGPGVPPGRVWPGTVGTRGLPSTLLQLSGLAKDAQVFGSSLPGLSSSKSVPSVPVYSETFLPATAYGWSPLRAVSDDRWRFVLAPRPELYDLVADPLERRNVIAEHPQERTRLEAALIGVARITGARAAPVTPDAGLTEALASLGYHSGASGDRAGTIDPKDGIAMLAELDQARQWAREGRAQEAVARMEDLVRRSPGNVPFLVRLAVAQSAVGRGEASLATLKHAVGVNPRLDFLHAHLADAYLDLGRVGEARAEYELALQLNPRFARAWLGLADAAQRDGKGDAERAVLRRAVAAGTDSAIVWSRLAELEMAAGDDAAAQRAADESTRLVPELAQAWLVRGHVSEKRGRTPEAIRFYERAIALGLADVQLAQHVARLQRGQGSTP